MFKANAHNNTSAAGSTIQHPHEARAPVVVVMEQQATECRRRRVDHDNGGIDFALQTLDKFLPHMIKRLYGLDNADKQKNITSTTCCIQRIDTIIYKYMSETKTCRHAMRTGCPASHGKAIAKVP